MTATRNNSFLDKSRFFGRQSATRCGCGVIFIRTRLHATCSVAGMSVILGIVFLLFDSRPLQAEMYVCRDQTGAINFTNVANGSDCKAINLKKEGSWANLSIQQSSDTATRYDREIRRIGRRYNVDPSLIKAIIHTESDFDYQAVSRSGAQGLMQLMPDTARDLQVSNPFDAHENIDGGTRYFRSLLDSFNEDLVLSLAAYNAGPGLVSRTGGVPRIPETLHYINKVLKRYKAYKATW